MSYIQNRWSASHKMSSILEKKKRIADEIDPYNDAVDFLGCDYRGIKNIVYDVQLDCVVFFYTSAVQNLKNVTVFCDVETASVLDDALDTIGEMDHICLKDEFEDAFSICWSYDHPTVCKLVYDHTTIF